MHLPTVLHRYVEIEGLQVFYREVGPQHAPTMLLLHGFPSSSHQFRRLLDEMGDRYHLIAPDYPGFGYSDAPPPASNGGTFTYNFDRLAKVTEAFCQTLGLERLILFTFDFGGPIGFRIAEQYPQWIAGLVVQNANLYDEGLSSMARQFIALRREDGAEHAIAELLTLEATRGQYIGGAQHLEHISPDGWTLDQYFLDLPQRKQIQIDLALDYHSNVARYPVWQAWLREHQPPTLIVWGRNDPFFIEAGAHAYLRDLPNARLHLFETGHFALEEMAPDITPLIDDFIARNW